MRLTNVMMTNTTLMHINRNMRNLDNIIRQIETGTRIQRPSDDPIIAARALMFRTSVHENAQFQRNVDQGIAWMNVTESTFNNINRELLFEMRNLAVQGANGDNNLENMQALIRQMNSLFNQIGHEMNQTFGGNYLFSGFRTDEPPIFTETNDRSFMITQHFNLSDIARESSFQRLVVPGSLTPSDSSGPNDPRNILEPVTHHINVLKLAFSGIDEDGGVPIIHVPGFDVISFSIHDENAYLPHLSPPPTPPANGVLHFIRETGELVMSDETAANFPREGISVTYQKTGFRQGDINPKVYFTGREIINTQTAHIPAGTRLVYSVTQYFSREAGVPVVDSAGDVTHFAFTLAFEAADIYTDSAGLRPSLPRDAYIVPGTNIVHIPIGVLNTNRQVSVMYSVELDSPILSGGTHIMADPSLQGVELVRAIGANGIPLPLDTVELNRSFDMHNQEIMYEFAARTHVAVNSLAKNVLTDKMFADFRRFFDFADSLHVSVESDLIQHFTMLGYSPEAVQNAVAKQLDREGSMATDILHQKFNNMLFLIDRHADNSTREQTLLGARMVRMELVQNRLEQDEISYTQLTSDNEDTDLIHATIKRFSAEAIFMASLRANTGVVQMSLANFLR